MEETLSCRLSSRSSDGFIVIKKRDLFFNEDRRILLTVAVFRFLGEIIDVL